MEILVSLMAHAYKLSIKKAATALSTALPTDQDEVLQVSSSEIAVTRSDSVGTAESAPESDSMAIYADETPGAAEAKNSA